MGEAVALGAASLGVWTRGDALDVVSRHVIRRLLRAGIWQTPLPGVYADGGHRLDQVQRAVAVALATGAVVPAVPGWQGDGKQMEPCLPAAVICGRTAARLWGMVLIDDRDPATGALDHLVDDAWSRNGRRARIESAAGFGEPVHHLVRHRFALTSDEVFRRTDGFVMTSAARTAFDCGRMLSPPALVGLLDDGLRRRLFTPEDLHACGEHHAGRVGFPAFCKAVAAADGRAESPNETLARLLLRPVVPDVESQVVITDARGVIIARADLASRSARLIFEADGRAGHAGDCMVARDQRRDRSTAELGWLTLRATWYDVRRRPDELVARVLAAQRARTRG